MVSCEIYKILKALWIEISINQSDAQSTPGITLNADFCSSGHLLI